MISAALCHILLSSNQHELIKRKRRALEWAANKLAKIDHPAEPYGKLLGWILEYDALYGEMNAPSPNAIRDFVENLKSSGKDSGNTEECKAQLEKVREHAESQGADTPIDAPSIIDKTIEVARMLLHARKGEVYTQHALGAVKINAGRKGKERPSTPDDGIEMMRKLWMTQDLCEDNGLPAGKLHEHTEILRTSMEEAIKPKEGSRVLTQWAHVDSRFIVGPRDNPYIGIAAYANQCKSTTAMTLAFNFWQQGLNIIYITLEHSPVECWQKFAFLVSGKYHGQFALPPLLQWKMYPETITPENMAGLDHIIEDLKNQRYSNDFVGKQGKIDFQEFRLWDDIVGYVEAENRRERVDALIIDYIGDLDTPGAGAGERDAAINELFRQGQVLTRTFDGGRGIIVVSPLQIKKSAYDAAKKCKIEQGIIPRRYYLDAISMYSVAIQRMDIILALYMEDPIGQQNAVEMHFVKVRDGQYPEARMMAVDEYTREVYDKSMAGDRLTDAHAMRLMRGAREQVLGVVEPEDDILKCLDVGGT